MQRKATKLTRDDWASAEGHWRGRVIGKELGTEVTILFFSSDEVGAGPKLHKHPYDELFIVRQGRALFTVGDEKIEAEAGDILLGPAEVPHKFVNLGPGRLETTDVHMNPEWIQTDLDDPEAGD